MSRFGMSDVPATATATATKSPIPDIGEFFLIPAHASQLALGRCDRCGAAFKGQEVLFLYRLVQGQSFGSPVKAHVPNCLRPWELTWLLEQPQLLQETQYLNWRMPSLLNPANPPYFWPRENDKPTAQTLRILRALIGYFQKCVTERQRATVKAPEAAGLPKKQPSQGNTDSATNSTLPAPRIEPTAQAASVSSARAPSPSKLESIAVNQIVHSTSPKARQPEEQHKFRQYHEFLAALKGQKPPNQGQSSSSKPSEPIATEKDVIDEIDPTMPYLTPLRNAPDTISQRFELITSPPSGPKRPELQQNGAPAPATRPRSPARPNSPRRPRSPPRSQVQEQDTWAAVHASHSKPAAAVVKQHSASTPGSEVPCSSVKAPKTTTVTQSSESCSAKAGPTAAKAPAEQRSPSKFNQQVLIQALQTSRPDEAIQIRSSPAKRPSAMPGSGSSTSQSAKNQIIEIMSSDDDDVQAIPRPQGSAARVASRASADMPKVRDKDRRATMPSGQLGSQPVKQSVDAATRRVTLDLTHLPEKPVEPASVTAASATMETATQTATSTHVKASVPVSQSQQPMHSFAALAQSVNSSQARPSSSEAPVATSLAISRESSDTLSSDVSTAQTSLGNITADKGVSSTGIALNESTHHAPNHVQPTQVAASTSKASVPPKPAVPPRSVAPAPPSRPVVRSERASSSKLSASVSSGHLSKPGSRPLPQGSQQGPSVAASGKVQEKPNNFPRTQPSEPSKPSAAVSMTAIQSSATKAVAPQLGTFQPMTSQASASIPGVNARSTLVSTGDARSQPENAPRTASQSVQAASLPSHITLDPQRGDRAGKTTEGGVTLNGTSEARPISVHSAGSHNSGTKAIATERSISVQSAKSNDDRSKAMPKSLDGLVYHFGTHSYQKSKLQPLQHLPASPSRQGEQAKTASAVIQPATILRKVVPSPEPNLEKPEKSPVSTTPLPDLPKSPTPAPSANSAKLKTPLASTNGMSSRTSSHVHSTKTSPASAYKLPIQPRFNTVSGANATPSTKPAPLHPASSDALNGSVRSTKTSPGPPNQHARGPTLADLQQKTPVFKKAAKTPSVVSSTGSGKGSSLQPLRPKFSSQFLATAAPVRARSSSVSSEDSERGLDTATIEANYRASLMAALQDTTLRKKEALSSFDANSPSATAHLKRTADQAALDRPHSTGGKFIRFGPKSVQQADGHPKPNRVSSADTYAVNGSLHDGSHPLNRVPPANAHRAPSADHVNQKSQDSAAGGHSQAHQNGVSLGKSSSTISPAHNGSHGTQVNVKPSNGFHTAQQASGLQNGHKLVNPQNGSASSKESDANKSALLKSAMESLKKLKTAVPQQQTGQPKQEKMIQVRIPELAQVRALEQFSARSASGQRSVLLHIGLRPLPNRQQWFMDDFCQLLKHVQKMEFRLDQLAEMIEACRSVEAARHMLREREFTHQLHRFAKSVRKERDEATVQALLQKSTGLSEVTLDALSVLSPGELVAFLRLRGLCKSDPMSENATSWLMRLQKSLRLPALALPKKSPKPKRAKSQLMMRRHDVRLAGSDDEDNVSTLHASRKRPRKRQIRADSESSHSGWSNVDAGNGSGDDDE